MSVDEGKFILKKMTAFEDMFSGKENVLPESDLCFQDGKHVYQYKFEAPEDDRNYEIDPGSYVLSEGMSGMELKTVEFKQRNLLDTVANTARILNEAKKFFTRLHVYIKLGRPMKRVVGCVEDDCDCRVHRG